MSYDLWKLDNDIDSRKAGDRARRIALGMDYDEAAEAAEAEEWRELGGTDLITDGDMV